ncbi:MAG: response regulator transcription factor [Oscillibacter sp.]|nr:response regulator transcription factor [Oscillibacter sp.]
MALRPKILVAEDEERIVGFISAVLTANGYDIITAGSGKETRSMLASHCPDLVLLDLGLPDMDGMDIIRSTREWTQLPIVVVTARDGERDKVAALDAGADDYITKPFGTHELLARIRTALRHARGSASSDALSASGIFTAGRLTIDYNKRWVLVDGENVHLTQNEYKIVSLLGLHAGKVLTYDYILKSIWGPSASGDNQVLRVHMANIRRKIERSPAEPEFIFTEVGVGYRIVEGDN